MVTWSPGPFRWIIWGSDYLQNNLHSAIQCRYMTTGPQKTTMRLCQSAPLRTYTLTYPEDTWESLSAFLFSIKQNVDSACLTSYIHMMNCCWECTDEAHWIPTVNIPRRKAAQNNSITFTRWKFITHDMWNTTSYNGMQGKLPSGIHSVCTWTSKCNVPEQAVQILCAVNDRQCRSQNLCIFPINFNATKSARNVTLQILLWITCGSAAKSKTMKQKPLWPVWTSPKGYSL